MDFHQLHLAPYSFSLFVSLECLLWLLSHSLSLSLDCANRAGWAGGRAFLGPLASSSSSSLSRSCRLLAAADSGAAKGQTECSAAAVARCSLLSFLPLCICVSPPSPRSDREKRMGIRGGLHGRLDSLFAIFQLFGIIKSWNQT